MKAKNSSVLLLAIETSCDETAVAVSKGEKILRNIVISQDIHKIYGGVVPEYAARMHDTHLSKLVTKALSEANYQPKDLHAIACTQGPGLLVALLTGFSFAKGLAWQLNIPLIGVDHLHAHVMSHFLDEPCPSFPFICLIASGGHTQLLLVKSYTELKLLGETQDDAVGEAFDKAASMLQLPYPGGVALDKLSQEGNPAAYSFPIPKMPALNYSFSGLKTSFLYFLKKQSSDFLLDHRADIAASMVHALTTTLMQKLRKAVSQTGISRVAVCGGVAANSYLRQLLDQEQKTHQWEIFLPQLSYCTDNAAMIARTAYYLYQEHGEHAFVDAQSVPYSRKNREAL